MKRGVALTLVVAALVALGPSAARVCEPSRAELVARVRESFTGPAAPVDVLAARSTLTGLRDEVEVERRFGLDGRRRARGLTQGLVTALPDGGFLHVRPAPTPRPFRRSSYAMVTRVTADGRVRMWGVAYAGATDWIAAEAGGLILLRACDSPRSESVFFAVEDEVLVVRAQASDGIVRHRFPNAESSRIGDPEGLLLSARRDHVLHALTWLSGEFRHGYVPEALARPGVQRRIDELTRSNDPWIREAALLAREPR